MNKLIKFLKDDREGASTFEFTLLAPFTFALIFITMAFFLVILSWTSFGSLANNIAEDLNIRQTGITRAAALQNQPNNGLQVYVVDGQQLSLLNSDKVTVDLGNSVGETRIKNAVIYAMNKSRKQFQFPYTDFNNVDVKIRRTDGSIPSYVEDTSDRNSNNFSSSVITVNISYMFAPIKFMGMAEWPGIPITATGYATVS